MLDKQLQNEHIGRMKGFIKIKGQQSVLSIINRLGDSQYSKYMKKVFGMAVHELEGVPSN
jgi:hypothetical protein